jgi:hypothetical protein
MGYQDNDRFGRDRNYGGYRASGERGSPGRYERERWEGRPDRERSWRGDDRYDPDDRGFFERAGDEVRSWFGDDEAERRRRLDEREYERERERNRRSYAGRERREDEDRWRGGGYVGGYYGSGFFTGDAAGDYGAGRGAGSTSMWGLGAGRDREAWSHDPYRSWRERQMLEFDRDYDEYRREHQSKFEQDFGSWRQGRQQQRQSLNQVKPHQEVVGSDGQHVGTVDKVKGDRIILTKTDADAGGHHHSIPCSWIVTVAERVEIGKTAEEAQRVWRDEENRSAFLGEEGRERDEGPHYLNRSFSGTY